MIFPPAGADGADDKIEPKEWVPVAIRLCGFAAMKTCKFARSDPSLDVTMCNIDEEGSTEANGSDIGWSEHAAVQNNVSGKIKVEVNNRWNAECSLESNRRRLHRASNVN